MSRIFYILILFLTIYSSSYAQRNWGGGIDDDKLHFGFTFQYISSEYKIYKKTDWRVPYYDTVTAGFITDSLYSISSPVSPGFGLGFVSNLRINDYMDLRFTPALVFTDRLLDYDYNDPAKFRQQKIQATMVDFPIGIKVKSDRIRNFRAYLIGGAKYSMDIVSKRKTDDSGNAAIEKFVKNTRTVIAYEAGIGFDLYFEFFQLSPELKLSNSFNSVLKAEDHPYSRPLNKLFLRNFQFSLYFE